MVVARKQGRDIVQKVLIRLYFPPDTACCTSEYNNMPCQEYSVIAEVHSYTRNSQKHHTVTIMDMEPTFRQKFAFNWSNLTKKQRSELKRAVYNATCESLGIAPNVKHINRAVPSILFEDKVLT